MRSLTASTREAALGVAALLEVRAGEGCVVATDLVNAHVGQQVLVLTGCAAQQLMAANGRVGDAVVVAIVDEADHAA